MGVEVARAVSHNAAPGLGLGVSFPAAPLACVPPALSGDPTRAAGHKVGAGCDERTSPHLMKRVMIFSAAAGVVPDLPVPRQGLGARSRSSGDSRPSSSARRTAALRLFTPSLAYMFCVCVRTVGNDTSVRARSPGRQDRVASSRRTSSSRSLSGSISDCSTGACARPRDGARSGARIPGRSALRGQLQQRHHGRALIEEDRGRSLPARPARGARQRRRAPPQSPQPGGRAPARPGCR